MFNRRVLPHFVGIISVVGWGWLALGRPSAPHAAAAFRVWHTQSPSLGILWTSRRQFLRLTIQNNDWGDNNHCSIASFPRKLLVTRKNLLIHNNDWGDNCSIAVLLGVSPSTVPTLSVVGCLDSSWTPSSMATPLIIWYRLCCYNWTRQNWVRSVPWWSSMEFRCTGCL